MDVRGGIMRTTAITGERGVKFARVIQWPTHVVNTLFNNPTELDIIERSAAKPAIICAGACATNDPYLYTLPILRLDILPIRRLGKVFRRRPATRKVRVFVRQPRVFQSKPLCN